MRRNGLLLVILVLAGSLTARGENLPVDTPLPMISRSPLAERAAAAVERGKQYLLARQHADGCWSENVEADPDGGETALVVLALLSSGVDHQTPEMSRAIEFLKKQTSLKTYSLGLRACVFAQLPRGSNEAVLKALVGHLQAGMITDQPHMGLYTYFPVKPESSGDCDYSNSQYGVLGVWYAQEAGMEVPDAYWRRVEMGWKSGQNKDGGWAYSPDGGDSYASMTAAGAATLFITNDYLHGPDAFDLMRPPANLPLQRAVEWLNANFAVDKNVGKDAVPQPDETRSFFTPVRKPRTVPYWGKYMLFGYERVGEASGLTRFGSHLWFDEGAKYLCDTQLDGGSWPGDGGFGDRITNVNTAYSLLFLSRGRSPVVMQKFKWGNRWNNRTRDIATYVRFLRHETERHVNWQICDADHGADEMRQSPLLWAASDRPMELKDAEAAAVKQYILEGGTLICANEGHTNNFARSVEALYEQMFPPYKFVDLPKDDAMLTGNFSTKAWTEPIRVITNGVRKLVVVYPSGDVPWKFQMIAGAPTNRLSPYTTTANLWVNMLAGADPLPKGESTWIDRDESTPAAKEKFEIARLQYDGNWNPEPMGWTRLANLLHNAGEMELTTREVPVEKLDGAVKLAHMTGTAAFTLKPAEEASMKNYLSHGGLLLFDAAGGSNEATAAMQGLLVKMFPEAKDAPLPIDHPIYSQHPLASKVSYRRSDQFVPGPGGLPRLRGVTLNGKLIAIVSPEDLSAGLVGYPQSGFVGYSPSSSAEVVRAVMRFAAQAAAPNAPQ